MSPAQPVTPLTDDPLELISSIGVLPVVVLDDAGHAEELAGALARGGLPCAEITLRTPAALDAIAVMSRIDGFLVGAGTVLTATHACRAIDAGARFLVSPGLSEAVVRAGREAGVPVVPGVATATEIMAALDLGLTTVKFFPAAGLGGPTTLGALAAAFPTVRFVPTGGIRPADLSSYLTTPAVVAVGGSWLSPPALIARGDLPAVTRLAAEAADMVAETRIREDRSSKVGDSDEH